MTINAFSPDYEMNSALDDGFIVLLRSVSVINMQI